MLFLEALAKLQAGSPMKRAGWAESEGYLKCMPGMDYVWKIVLVPNPNAGNFIFSIADFHGDDWEEFVIPSAPVEAEVIEEAAPEAA